MTHDELLALLKGYAELAGLRMDRNAWLILCDVVELHKMCCDLEELCNECNPNVLYPCPTIQAIKKELE